MKDNFTPSLFRLCVGMKSALVAGLLVVAIAGSAQIPSDNTWRWGIQSGVNFSKISDIKETIIPAKYNDTTYDTKGRYRNWGYTGGVFLYTRFKDSYVVFQPEVSYSIQGGDFDYKDHDTISPLTYKVRFNYQYINLAPIFKVYPFYKKSEGWQGLHFGLGIQLGINVTNSKVQYTSTPDPQYDLYISDAMSEVLKGRIDVEPVVELGYEHWFQDKDFSLSLNGRWYVGIVDMMQTQANGFGFLERNNFSQHFQAALSATFLLVEN